MRTIEIPTQRNIYGQLLNLIKAHSLNREIRVLDHTGEKDESWPFNYDRNSYLLIHSDICHAFFADRDENTLYKLDKNTGDSEEILLIYDIWHSVVTPVGRVVQKRSRDVSGKHSSKPSSK